MSRRRALMLGGIGLLAVALAAASIATGGLPRTSGETDRTGSVIVSTALIGEVVHRLTEGRVPLRVLLPPGAEVHEWEPSAREVAEVGRAVLVIYFTDSLEGWMRGLVESSGYRGPVIRLEDTPGVKLIPIDRERVGEEHEGAHQDRGAVDPHLWLSLENYIAIVRHIADRLRASFPELREVIDRNEASLVESAASLLAEYRERLRPYAGRTFLTEHLAFRYLAIEFGLRNAAIKGLEEQEPDPRRLVELRSLVAAEGIRVVYVDGPSATSRTVESFARELGLRVLRLDAMESMTLEEALSGRGYLERMRENLSALLEGFEG